MTYTTLISTSTLAAHLADPNWVVVDCRFDLQNPDWGFGEYQRAHIPGAVYAHLDRDLSSAMTPTSGRHPLPAPEDFSARCGAWGILPRAQVIAYDAGSGAYAARLWWMLRWIGHAAVAVLDGGWAKWACENRATRGGVESRAPAPFVGAPRAGWTAEVAEVEQMRADRGRRLIDARAAVRYRGEEELIYPVAGHIPGAVNRPYESNLGADGTFLSREELRRQFEAVLGNVPPERAVVYCGSGVTACHNLLALEHAGLRGANGFATRGVRSRPETGRANCQFAQQIRTASPHKAEMPFRYVSDGGRACRATRSRSSS